MCKFFEHLTKCEESHTPPQPWARWTGPTTLLSCEPAAASAFMATLAEVEAELDRATPETPVTDFVLRAVHRVANESGAMPLLPDSAIVWPHYTEFIDKNVLHNFLDCKYRHTSTEKVDLGHCVLTRDVSTEDEALLRRFGVSESPNGGVVLDSVTYDGTSIPFQSIVDAHRALGSAAEDVKSCWDMEEYAANHPKLDVAAVQAAAATYCTQLYSLQRAVFLRPS
jgi:hypothetical protein